MVPLHHRLDATRHRLDVSPLSYLHPELIDCRNFIHGLLLGEDVREHRGQWKKPEEKDDPDKNKATMVAWAELHSNLNTLVAQNAK